MTTVNYRTVDEQELTAQQSLDWLAIIQAAFGSDAGAGTIKEATIYRANLGRQMSAIVTLELQGSASKYVSSKPARLVSYVGGVATWLEKRSLKSMAGVSGIAGLVSAVHGSLASDAYQLTLERGSPNVSKLSHVATCTPEEWATAEAAGSPLGSFLGVV